MGNFVEDRRYQIIRGKVIKIECYGRVGLLSFEWHPDETKIVVAYIDKMQGKQQFTINGVRN